MSIEDEITREVRFTDYGVRTDIQHVVAVTKGHDGKPVAIVRAPWIDGDMDEPGMLRSLAACLNAAADEMEGAGRV